MRQHPLSIDCRWKRTCYVPCKPPDPEEELEACKELEGLSVVCC